MDRKKHDVDWERLESEYITGNMSYRDLAEKHGVSSSTIFKQGKRRSWPAKRKKHRSRVVAKAVQKTENKQVRVLAKELTLLNKIEKHLDRALSDADQFNRHLVTYGRSGATNTEERVYDKMDMKALRDAMAIAREAEKMRRSIQGVLTVSEQEQLDIARKRLELDQRKQDQTEQTDTEVTITFSDNEEEWSL